MKKFFFLFAALICSMTMFADAVKIGNAYYYLYDDKTAELTHKPDGYGYGFGTTVDIPTTVEYYGTTYQVTRIDNFVFHNCKQLNEINVESDNPYFCSVDGVLYSKDMTQLVVCPRSKAGAYTIPNSVTNIHGHAFEYCVNLTSTIIGDGVENIGLYAFAYCYKMKDVTIGSSVESINSHAFYFCESLEEITLPNSVKRLGSVGYTENDVFTGYANLTTINIGSGLGGFGQGDYPFM